MYDWLQFFQWESESQQKGFHGFCKWARNKNLNTMIRPFDLFILQKDHEYHEWLMETVGHQIKELQNEIYLLRKEILELKKEKKNV